MKNKVAVDGQRHDRPCFFAMTDKKQNGLFWLIPISSRIEKYKRIYAKKVQRYGECNTIYFAKVLGKENAFLIQNMFPITQKYISNIYIDRNTSNAVTISDNEAKKIIHNARDVLKLHNRGINLIFPKIDIIKEKLVKQLHSKQIENKLDKEKMPWNDYLIRLTHERGKKVEQSRNQDQDIERQ